MFQEEIDPEPSSGDEEKEAEETSVEEGGEEEGGGGDEEGGDEDEDEDDEEEEEEEEEVEAVDPAEELREKCAAGSKCAPLWTEFEKCEERVNSRTNTEETCVQELFDFLKCQDKCVSILFKTDLKLHFNPQIVVKIISCYNFTAPKV